MDKGLLPAGTSIDIQSNLTAIENFQRLNAMGMNPRKLMPITPSAQPFITFTEYELAAILWKSDTLQKKLQGMHGATDYSPSLADVYSWMKDKAPGTVLTKLITDAGLGRQKRRMPGIGKSFNNLAMPSTLDEIREHLESIKGKDFDPRTYNKRGYCLLGSIKTDGFRLQLTAFKLKELLSVRYRRLPAGVLPPRITSTVGGVDYYLTEVRNIIKTKQDVSDLWGCEPEKIKILGLDLGQAFVVGASALLPEESPAGNDIEAPAGNNHVFYNLAINSKAVYQPMLKFRRWMEERKRSIPPGAEESISDIESRLPALRGKDANVEQFVTALEGVKERLDHFYNGDRSFKKHRWDAKKAMEAEFNIITDRLLNMVGGSLGRRRSEADKVIIGVGLGKFSSNSRLSTLHESFQSHFVQRVRICSLEMR